MTPAARKSWALLWPALGLVLSGCATADIARPATGDLHLNYTMPEAREADVPYRVFLPSAWNPRRSWPLVVVLHGYAGTADSPFADARGALQREAERHGFVVLSPNGFNGMADYGANLPLPRALNRFDKPLTMSPQAETALAEADVLHVVDRAMQDYAIDPRRIFLMGNSMGMTGVLHFARLQHERWCAISPSGGPPWRDYPVERLRSLAGALLVHGGNDDIALPADTIALAERAKAAGVNARAHIVPGGTHGSAWVDYLPETFAFFARQNCAGRGGKAGR
jgi:predicted peptidase